MSEDKLASYARAGIQIRLGELAEEFAEFAVMLPDEPAIRALITAGAAAQRALGGQADADDEPKPKPNGERKIVRRPRRPAARTHGESKAWDAGRPVLAMLAKAKRGMATVNAVARRFKLTRPGALWRLKMRAKRGHVRAAIGDNWEITPAGRKALERDQDTEA